MNYNMNLQRRAFTLIELLVVVAIIALLVSILMPSLGRAKHLAKTAVCMASLHAIHTGAMSYVAETRVLPQAQNTTLYTDGTTNTHANHTMIDRETATFATQIAWALGSPVKSHIELDGTVLTGCPHFVGVKFNGMPVCEPVHPETGLNAVKRGYGMNPFYCCYTESSWQCGDDAPRGRNLIATWIGNPTSTGGRPHYAGLEQVTRPSSRTFIGDSNEVFMYAAREGGGYEFSQYVTAGPETGRFKWWAPTRHSWGQAALANHVMFDGHVESLGWDDGLKSLQNP